MQDMSGKQGAERVSATGGVTPLSVQLKRHIHIAVPVALLVVLTAVMAAAAPRFLTADNLISVARSSAIYIILSIGMTFIITSRGIDLSIGSILGLTSVVMGGLVIDAGWSPYAGIAVAVLFGAGLGLFNAVLISYGKIPPFIATIGMMASYRGFALVHSAGAVRYNFPAPIAWLGRGAVGPLPVAVVIALVFAALAHVVFKHTRFGRYCIAIGGDVEATRRAGVPVRLYEASYYVLMGALCGFAGVMLTGRLDGTQAVLGEGMELHVIASVIIGGTSLFGGRGTIIGSVIGALILGVIANALILLGVPWFWQRVAIGFIVVGAVRFNTWRERMAKQAMSL